MVQSIGVDGCPGGWVAVELGDGHFSGAAFRPSFAEILTTFPQATAVGVDIPIGLPESGRRAADIAARSFVGARRSSVFTTPTRELLETAWRPGLGITIQSHGLGQRIFEVERAIDGDRTHDRIYEVHPEVSFVAMKGGPLAEPKTSWNGQQHRRRLLRATGIDLPDDLPSVGVVPADDLLDAAAAAWSAHRIATGQAATLPATAPIDGKGRAVAIWY